MSDLRSEIQSKICDRYIQAVYNKDADELCALYANDVRVFDTWGLWSYEGLESWKLSVNSWLSSLTNERVRVAFDDLRAVGSGDMIAVSASVTYSAEDEEGRPLRSMQNRLSWMVQKQGQAYLILHEHTSVPIDFSTLKGILTKPGQQK